MHILLIENHGRESSLKTEISSGLSNLKGKIIGLSFPKLPGESTGNSVVVITTLHLYQGYSGVGKKVSQEKK